MQIEIKIDQSCKEPRLIIVTDKMTEEIQTLVKRLSESSLPILIGFRGDTTEVLEPDSIYRIYTENGRVYAAAEHTSYLLRQRLYQLEDRLDSRYFVRISNSELINLKKVKNFDLSFTGTICVQFTNGTVTYVSRRYVSKIKQVLGM